MSTLFVTVGLACIIGAIIGGGLKILGVELPIINTWLKKIGLFAVGVVCVMIGLNSEPKPPPPSPPSIVKFYPSPEKIDRGGSTTLIWQVEDATSVEITPKVGGVAFQGSIPVKPVENTTYTLTARNSVGVEKYAQTDVIVNPVIAPQETILTGAKLNFHTTDENKDGDTRVNVNLVCNGIIMASVSDTWGEFPENTDSGWKDLKIMDKLYKDKVNGNCRVDLVEAPNGHDEWHFAWTLALRFSDVPVYHQYPLPAGNVDYDRPTASGVLY